MWAGPLLKSIRCLMSQQSQYILLYSDENDPVVQALKDLVGVSLPVKQLLDEVEIFDQIVDGRASLEWTHASFSKVTNHERACLINRVVSIKESWFQSFHSEDQEFARSEFTAYVRFAVGCFKHATDRPGPYGIAGNQFPMPYQWSKVSKELGLSVPRFSYSSSGCSAPGWIRGDFYSFYSWKPKDSDSGQGSEEARFHYERPAGDPVIAICAFGRTILVDALGGARVLDPTIERRANDVARVLGQGLQEVLFFRSNQEIVFGMASKQFRTLEKFPFLLEWLREGFQAWRT